jgi:hypothetical protein
VKFLHIGRKDLIARLGFMASAVGYLFYPVSLLPVAFLTWRSTKIQNITRPAWPFSLSGLVLVGACFYTDRLDGILYVRMENWSIGLLMIFVSVALFWNKRLLKSIK